MLENVKDTLLGTGMLPTFQVPKFTVFGILVPQLHLNNDKSFVLGELGKPRLVLIIEPQAKFGYYFSNHV